MKRIAITIAYLISLLLPNLMLMHLDRCVPSVIKLLIALVLIISWHLMLKRAWLSILISLPFFIMLPWDLFYLLTYHEPPTTHIFSIISETNPQETSDYLRGRLLPIALGTAVCLSIWLCMLIEMRKSPWQASNNKFVVCFASRAIIGVYLLMIAIMVVPIFENIKLSRDAYATADINSGPSFFKDKLPKKITKIKGVFPFGRFVSVAEYYREESQIKAALQQKQKFKFGAYSSDKLNERKIIVLIIGETGRPDRWNINGYTRDTSPLLKKERNLISLIDMISPFPDTYESIPVIVTRNSGVLQGANYKEKSIVGIFKEAGFRAYWISNQPTFGAVETSITHFAREADEVIYTNPSNNAAYGLGTYDDALLKPIDNILHRNENKQFFVLHTMGSHDAYHRRYPDSFDIFKPSLKECPDANYHDVKNKITTNNAYDNSILYTDFILSKILSLVKANDANSVILYAADHGEDLFDGSCAIGGGHGGKTRYSFPVASFLWYSDKYASNYKDRVIQLKANSTKKLTTEIIFHSLVDIAGINYPLEDLSKSIASAKFKERTRYVNLKGPENWDRLCFEGDCKRIKTCR